MLLPSEIERALEDLLDKSDLETVRGALARVCFEKSEHVATNWQDAPLARLWQKAGERILNVKLPEGI